LQKALKKLEFRSNTGKDKTLYKCNFPEKLEECGQVQFVAIASWMSKPADDIRAKVEAVIALCRLSPKLIRQVDNEQLAGMVFVLDSMCFPLQVCGKWFIPAIKTKTCTLYGPGDEFMNVVFGEFCLADTLFLAFLQSGNNAYLYQLVATLYRLPYHKSGKDKQFRGDVRSPFNPHQVEALSKEIARLAPETINAVLYNYTLQRRLLETKYPHVFPPVAENEKQKKGQGWSEVIRNIAPTVLDIERVENLNMHQVLTDLNEKLKEQAKK
jgi:hypothetical protein